MDPYAENPSLWSGFQISMLIAMRVELNARLPKRYAAAAERYVWQFEPDPAKRTPAARSDTHLAEQGGLSSAGIVPADVDAPDRVMLPAVRREANRHLKIMNTQSRRMVTVIELLSPSIKMAGADRELYLTQRISLLSAGISLVELDLLRQGERLPSDPPLPSPADYFVLLCRAQRFPKAAVWPFSVRDPFPEIPIPLDPGDSDALLPLRACLDRAFGEGRHERDLDYANPPVPPLAEPDAAWARDLLAQKAR
jgi:hypothetical protein